MHRVIKSTKVYEFEEKPVIVPNCRMSKKMLSESLTIELEIALVCINDNKFVYALFGDAIASMETLSD